MSAELTKVVLVGSLGKAIGISEWELDVKSPSEAIRAIDINTRGKLAQYLSGPARDKLYRVAIQKRTNVIDPKEVVNRSGRATIYIMPTLRGRDKGFWKVIAGVALLAAVYFTGGFAAGAAGWASTAAGGFTAAGAVVAGFGISLVLGGISQILTPKPQGANASPEQAQSTSFPGNAGAVVQGGCVPVVYGRALVTPIPVSVTVTNSDVSTSAAGTKGTVVTVNLPGGGQQNKPGDGNQDGED